MTPARHSLEQSPNYLELFDAFPYPDNQLDNQFDNQPQVRFVHAVTARRQCKIFAGGVNFSRSNAIYNINESTKYI